MEHYAGAFPLWLAPAQAMIIPIRKEDEGYTGGIKEKLLAEGIRVDLDCGNETLTKRIRNAEMYRYPYIIVIGQKEAQAQKIAVRKRGAGDQGQTGVDEFVAKIREEIKNKS